MNEGVNTQVVNALMERGMTEKDARSAEIHVAAAAKLLRDVGLVVVVADREEVEAAYNFDTYEVPASSATLQ